VADSRDIPSPDPTSPPHDPSVQQPANRTLRAHGYNLPPGPGRRMDIRHWARMEGTGLLVMLVLLAVIVWFVGTDIGLWRDLFG
jgi:hypothetical protein